MKSSSSQIVCPVAPWFFRRVGLVAILFAALSAYFFYDGLIGYPAKNFNATLYEWFEAGKWSTPKAEMTEGTEIVFSETQSAELNEAYLAGSDDQTWAQFAATLHLASTKPKHYSDSELSQQLGFGFVLGGLAIVVGLFLLKERKRTLEADALSITLPNKKSVGYADINRLDLRKWDKGIGVLHGQARDGKPFQAKIDDYKFSGASEIIDRLRSEKPEMEVLLPEAAVE